MIVNVKGTRAGQDDGDLPSRQRYLTKEKKPSKAPFAVGAFLLGLAVYLKSALPSRAEPASDDSAPDAEPEECAPTPQARRERDEGGGTHRDGRGELDGNASGCRACIPSHRLGVASRRAPALGAFPDGRFPVHQLCRLFHAADGRERPCCVPTGSDRRQRQYPLEWRVLRWPWARSRTHRRAPSPGQATGARRCR